MPTIPPARRALMDAVVAIREAAMAREAKETGYGYYAAYKISQRCDWLLENPTRLVQVSRRAVASWKRQADNFYRDQSRIREAYATGRQASQSDYTRSIQAITAYDLAATALEAALKVERESRAQTDEEE